MRRATEEFRVDSPVVSELAAGAVLAHAKSGEVLLLHHRSEDRWCLPKGHVEIGESLLQAASRELVEETGIHKFSLGPELGGSTYRFYDPARRLSVVKTTIYFFATTGETRADPEDLFDDSRWLPIPAARDLVPFDTDRTVLESAQRALAGSRTSDPGAE